MTHAELVATVQSQAEEIERLSKLVDRLYHASELVHQDAEAKVIAEIEARAAVLEDEEPALRVRANEGDAKAQFSLGWMYYYAKGVAEDSVQGVQWWQQAAAAGHAEAQWELAGAYASGRGLPRDHVTAQVWYIISAENGFLFAKKDRDKHASEMFAGHLIRAEEQAAQWLKDSPHLVNAATA